MKRQKNRQKIRGVEDWKIGNDKKQEMKNNSHGMTDTGKTTGCPTETFGHDRRAGFTLVELVIVIAIVIILSVISVPIYRGYVDKSRWTEGYALLGAILSAQKAYYSEHGNFLCAGNGGRWTCNNEVLLIDARGNKYFTYFEAGGEYPAKYGCADRCFDSAVKIPDELAKGNVSIQYNLQFNITRGTVVTYAYDHDMSMYE